MGRIIAAIGAEWRRRDLRLALEREGHVVSLAATASEALEETRSGVHELLIVDSCIGGSGNQSSVYDLCRAIRSESDMGIIVLISDGAHCRIDMLNAGADDYLPEQFVFGELLARVRAILRRVSRLDHAPKQIVLHDRAINLHSHKVQGPGSRVSHLTPKEFYVLQHLINRADKSVTNQDLAQAVWQRDGSGNLEYVRSVISQLRRKIERDHNNPEYIRTERSVGYRFTLPARLRAAGPQYRAAAYQTGSQAMAL
jgi:two-component system KDP operon response regulator KdpE